jgi:hypothetical protein
MMSRKRPTSFSLKRRDSPGCGRLPPTTATASTNRVRSTIGSGWDSRGTMSEYELGLLRQRAQEALRQKISRSEVWTEMPIGYVRTETNGIEKTPDPQVLKVIAEVFLQFRRLGSVGQVVALIPGEKSPLW